jgi:acetyltransferase EpsM
VTQPVFVFGAGPQGRVVLDVLRSAGTEIGGFLDDRQDAVGQEWSGLRVFAAAAWLASGPHPGTIVIAIGNNYTRMRVGQRVTTAGYRLHAAIHASAVVAEHVAIGEGSLLCMHAGVGTGCTLGINVVINTGTTVDHDSVIEDGAYLSPGVHSAGDVRIGANTFIGAGAILGPGVRIGADAIVGAGAVVLDDLPPRSVSYGTPARVHRTVDPGVDWSRILGGRRP